MGYRPMDEDQWVAFVRDVPRPAVLATLCVQDDRPPFSFVTVEGTVELIEDLEQVRAWAARLEGRSMGADQAEAYGERNGVPGELVVKLTPVKVVSAFDVAD